VCTAYQGFHHSYDRVCTVSFGRARRANIAIRGPVLHALFFFLHPLFAFACRAALKTPASLVLARFFEVRRVQREGFR
jgi:hypothetical protein